MKKILIGLCVLMMAFSFFSIALFSEETEIEETEPNDSMKKATRLEPGMVCRGNLSTKNDTDWFKVELLWPGKIVFQMDTDETTYYSYVWYGEVLKDDGKTSLNSGNISGKQATSFGATDLEPGTYYLKLTKASGGNPLTCNYDSIHYLLSVSLACAHKESYEEIETIPTCLVEGKLVTICEDCAGVVSETILPALEHTWSDWNITQDSSFIVPGKRERICLSCKLKENENYVGISYLFPLILFAVTMIVALMIRPLRRHYGIVALLAVVVAGGWLASLFFAPISLFIYSLPFAIYPALFVFVLFLVIGIVFFVKANDSYGEERSEKNKKGIFSMLTGLIYGIMIFFLLSDFLDTELVRSEIGNGISALYFVMTLFSIALAIVTFAVRHVWLGKSIGITLAVLFGIAFVLSNGSVLLLIPIVFSSIVGVLIINGILFVLQIISSYCDPEAGHSSFVENFGSDGYGGGYSGGDTGTCLSSDDYDPTPEYEIRVGEHKYAAELDDNGNPTGSYKDAEGYTHHGGEIIHNNPSDWK